VKPLSRAAAGAIAGNLGGIGVAVAVAVAVVLVVFPRNRP